jgi:hypothetical protein
MVKNQNFFQKEGFIKAGILSKKDNRLILDEIKKIYLFNSKKTSLDDHIKNLYKVKPALAGKCYDMINQSVEIQKIFISKRVIKNVRKFLRTKKKVPIAFADFQFLVMLPDTKKENLGWHQDSQYFKPSNIQNSSIILWTSISTAEKDINGSLYVLPGSHKNGLINHKENSLNKRKKVSQNKRGKYFVDEKNLKKFGKEKKNKFQKWRFISV